MRSRAARLTASTAAWIALGAAAFFTFTNERQISERRQAVRAFDQQAREVTGALADMRSAQQAYVAAGQGVAFWVPKVAALQQEMARWLDGLRESAASTGARTSLMEASARITEFSNVDRRARDYIRSGQTLMAGDVVFTEGGETAAAATRQVEAARLAEHQAFDAAEAGLRRRQASIVGAAVVFGSLIMALLTFAAPGQRTEAATAIDRHVSDSASARETGDLMLRDIGRQPPLGSRAPAGQGPVSSASTQPRGSVPLLKAAADLCTEFARVNDPGDLPSLLARVADVMDASGLVVWLGNTTGGDLRPVLAHGYPEHVLARMPNVPRSADNAAATAYRTGKLQIVLRRPGGSNGAVVAPLLAPQGCVGALTAEILAGSEATDSVQALAALVAAQLTGVLAGSAAVSPAEAPAGRTASG